MTGRVTLTEAGFEVEAELIGDAFRIEPSEVTALMRSGTITSLCERGVSEDEGRWRLTFFHGGRALRLTVDGMGEILLRATFDAPRRGPVLPATRPAASAFPPVALEAATAAMDTDALLEPMLKRPAGAPASPHPIGAVATIGASSCRTTFPDGTSHEEGA